MMEQTRIIELLERFTANTCTPAEKKELMELLGSYQTDEAVRNYIDGSWGKQKLPYQLTELQSQTILSSIVSQARKNSAEPVLRPVRSRNWYWAAAALVIIFLGSMGYFLPIFKTSAKNTSIAGSPHDAFKNDIAPGSAGAVLMLADGSVITLDSAADGNLTSGNGSHIIKSGGSVQYVLAAGTGAYATGFNSMTTPRGRQFKLILEDGSHVWLNAESSIRFPAVFDKKDRHVEVTGEAYFEVAKDSKRTFTVSVNGLKVEVLGTHFNINAYADEPSVETTLLEGSVKVMKNNKARLLSPGQQARLTRNDELSVLKEVNTGDIIAWKNELFSFNNTDIKTLMRQLSRWYNVDITMPSDIDPVTFTGNISRNSNLADVLKMLELTGEVKFAIEGKRVTVTTI